MKPCTNSEPCLRAGDGKAHSPVCHRLVAQGAKPRVTQRELAPAVLHPPKLDVAKGEGLVGCGCGRVWVPDRKTARVVDGISHRYGLPCRKVNGG